MSQTRQHNPPTATPTAAVLYPGELGAALASLLRSRGLRVITTLTTRSQATAQRCQQAGVTVLQSLEEVVRHANVVFSLVPPAAAEEMANRYCDLAHLAPAGAIYVDVNSIGPDLATTLAVRLEQAGIDFVDAAINGLAKNLTRSATLFLSGPRAPEIASLFENSMRVQILQGQAGKASSMKMLLAGLSKGICALYAELALLAQRQNMSDEFAQATAQIYPGISALVERMLPTYAQHAPRRATEMSELEQTAQLAGLDPCVIAAVRALHEKIAAAAFDAAPGAQWTVSTLIESLAQQQLLAADPSAALDVTHSVSGRK